MNLEIMFAFTSIQVAHFDFSTLRLLQTWVDKPCKVSVSPMCDLQTSEIINFKVVVSNVTSKSSQFYTIYFIQSDIYNLL